MVLIPDEIKRSIGYRTPSSADSCPTPSRSNLPCCFGGAQPQEESLLHVDDLADACVFLSKLDEDSCRGFFNNNRTPLINIGCGEDHTIKEIAAITADVVGYKGDVLWDQDKPDGTLQKLLDISKIKKLGWKPNIALKDGIQDVYEWYLKGTK